MSKKVQPKVLNKNCDIFVQSPNKSMHLMVPPSQKDEPNKIVQPGPIILGISGRGRRANVGGQYNV